MTAYGAFSVAGRGRRLGVRREDGIVDLDAAARAGRLAPELADLVRDAPDLNRLLAAGHDAWAALDDAVADLDGPVVGLTGTELHLSFRVGDYVDFYSSLEHATNLGRILRPDGDPLLPNWRHLPVGYHGRAGTVVVSGSAIRRPWGQTNDAATAGPSYGPSRMLDYELEVGFVTGDGPRMATPIPAVAAERHIFGLVLVNDWSARDLQSWEYQPLGPFLSKSFATSVSPWVVRLPALAPHRVDGPVQDPAVLPYLRVAEPRNLDLRLEVHLRTSRMIDAGAEPVCISASSFAGMYWSMAQQLTHLTSNGATVRAGDLCASGTVSGSTPGSEGSLMERTWRGTRPIELPNGEQRGFLEDGDEVTMSGRCGTIDLGSVVGRVWE